MKCGLASRICLQHTLTSCFVRIPFVMCANSFFTAMPSSVSVTASGAKRKADEAKGGANKKGASGAKSAFQKRK